MRALYDMVAGADDGRRGALPGIRPGRRAGGGARLPTSGGRTTTESAGRRGARAAQGSGTRRARRVRPHFSGAGRAAAIRRLRDDELREGFADFDRVVVDEVQDLTLLETAVVVELCLAIARRRGQAPWLRAAGDDGQTVRPSRFDWGALNACWAGASTPRADVAGGAGARAPERHRPARVALSHATETLAFVVLASDDDAR